MQDALRSLREAFSFVGEFEDEMSLYSRSFFYEFLYVSFDISTVHYAICKHTTVCTLEIHSKIFRVQLCFGVLHIHSTAQLHIQHFHLRNQSTFLVLKLPEFQGDPFKFTLLDLF